MDIHLLKNVFEQSVLAFVGCEILVLYPGRNYFAAHSLGNMLVSSAIQDWRMPYEKYFLVNAAVATEAYDPAAATGEAKNRMTPADWRDLDDSVKASHYP